MGKFGAAARVRLPSFAVQTHFEGIKIVGLFRIDKALLRDGAAVFPPRRFLFGNFKIAKADLHTAHVLLRPQIYAQPLALFSALRLPHRPDALINGILRPHPLARGRSRRLLFIGEQHISGRYFPRVELPLGDLLRVVGKVLIAVEQTVLIDARGPKPQTALEVMVDAHAHR